MTSKSYTYANPGNHDSGVRILYPGLRATHDTRLAPDAFTQANPPIIKDPATISDTLKNFPWKGVIGGSIAFTRPDAGNGPIGGPVDTMPSKGAIRPVGFFMNHAHKEWQSNQAQGSGQLAYVAGVLGLTVYETYVLTGPNAGDPLDWQPGDYLYPSINGFVTNIEDEYNCYELWLGYPNATQLGVVRRAPDPNDDVPELIFDNPV